MVTKKRIKRIINIFNHLRGPKNNRHLIRSIKPFNNILDNTFGKETKEHFYREVMNKHAYYTKEIMNEATKFFNNNIQIID